MTRFLISLTSTLLLSQTLFAHFMFVHVIEDARPHAEIHFSESAWDFSSNQRMVGLIAKTRAWLPDGTELKFDQQPFGLVAPMASGEDIACAAFSTQAWHSAIAADRETILAGTWLLTSRTGQCRLAFWPW